MVKHSEQWAKTHQYLQSIVLDEMQKKEIKKITVSSICRIAHINRSTFYDHYDDIIALTDDARDYMDQQLIQKFMLICKQRSYKYLNQDSIEALLGLIKENGKFYKIRLRTEKELFYNDELYELDNRIQNTTGEKMSKRALYYYLVAFQATFINVTNEWAKHGYEDSIKDIARIIISASPQSLLDASPQIFF